MAGSCRRSENVDRSCCECAGSKSRVKNIDYDSKGRREKIEYKNGTTTSYVYDPFTFRLTKLFTTRAAGDNCQDLHYTYDATGNITSIRDRAQQTIFFRNKKVEPSNEYTYDALYRLTEATGREHLGQGTTPIPHSFDDAQRIGLLHKGDGNAMATYTESFVYDAVGNIVSMQHSGSDSSVPGWTRSYIYSEQSLLEPAKTSNRLSSATVGTITDTYLYDEHGNMTRMPHFGAGAAAPNMFWDYKDQLYKVELGGGGRAFYTYDANGERVRKVWSKSAVLTEERIYLGGFEVFRSHPGAIGVNTETLARETLHIMDDKQRIALIERRTIGNDQGLAVSKRYQFANHLGTACLELDEQSQIVTYEENSPFGSSTYQAVRSQTETPKRYRYTGKERDEESGLYYHGARYYAPWLGRWTACDPLYLKDTSNLYVYSLNNPVVAKDPTGGPVWLIPVAIYLGWRALESAGETAVEAGVAKVTDDKDFSAAGTFAKNMIVNSVVGLIPGAVEAKLGTKAAVYGAKLAVRTAGDATYDTLRGKGSFEENLVKSGVGNVGGDLAGAALKKAGGAVIKKLKGAADNVAGTALEKEGKKIESEIAKKAESSGTAKGVSGKKSTKGPSKATGTPEGRSSMELDEETRRVLENPQHSADIDVGPVKDPVNKTYKGDLRPDDPVLDHVDARANGGSATDPPQS
ncbi:MAG: RHS repeat-associated core domain-containing protein [Bacteroidota bacterium]